METSGMQMEATGTLDRVQESIFIMAAPGQNCRAVLIPEDEIDIFWPYVEPLLKKVQPHTEGEVEPQDFIPFLKRKEMNLWVAVQGKDLLAVLITQVIPYPRKSVLRIISAGGKDMYKWLALMPTIENYGRLNHCSYLELWGRKGWSKVLKDWKTSYHIFTKEI